MATIDLGKIKLVWRGTYSGSTAYTVDDVVQHTDTITSSFICTTASTGNAPSTGGSVHSSWAYLAKGGVAGTDVGTTITTQGDLLYRDGSGLQRLAKGTAAQALLMNSGATAPEWGTISSDFTKIAVTGDGTDVGSVSIPIDRTTYTSFDIYWQSIPASDGAHPRARIRNAGGAISAGNYKSSYVQTQGGGGSISSNHENGQDYWMLGGNGGYSDLEGHGFHLIYTPHKTSRHGQSGGTYNGDLLTWQGYRIDESDNWRDITGGGKYDVVIDDVTHLDMYYSTGDIAMYNYTIYGRKA